MNTMATIPFDTLSMSKRLKSKGFSETQAEAIAEEMKQTHEINFEHLATQADLRELELRLTNVIKDMQIKIGVMIIGLGGFMAAIKFFG